MTIVVGGAGAGSSGSGAISGGFKIFELMFNQTTGAALPAGTVRPAIFADKTAMQTYFTTHANEFERFKASGRVCEIGTIDGSGKPLTINNEAYSYVEGQADPYVNVVGGLLGPKGDKGDAGDISKLKVDYPLTINTDQGVTTISADDAITFKGGKIGEQDAHLDIDIQRDCAIRFVTDNPAVGYNVVDAYADSQAPDGYYAKFGSRSLTSYLTSKENIRTSIDGVDGVVYTSQNPQPVTVPVIIDSNIQYESVEALIEHPKKIVFDENDTGITITLDISLDELDSRPDYSVSFTVANTVPSVGNCYIHHNQIDRTFVVGPSSTVTYFYSIDRQRFVRLQEQGGVSPYPVGLLDFSSEPWKVPDGNKTIAIPTGTIQNLADEVNGAQASATVDIVCIKDRENPQYNRASHLVTLISDDPKVNGLQYLRVAPLKENILDAPFKRIGEGSPSGSEKIDENNPLIAVDPADQSEHNAIDVTDGEIRYGSPSIKTEIRTSEERVKVDIRGEKDETIAYLSDISGSGVDPSKGFTLDKGSDIKATLQDGTTITELIGLASNADNLLLGSEKVDTIIEAKTGAYVDINGSVKKVLLEGDGGEGFPDNGPVNNLTASYETLSVGKWYVDGWDNSSGLPDWDLQDRIAVLTVFGGYDDIANGAFWMLASHRKGIYASVKSSGVTGASWYQLDGSGSGDHVPVVVDHTTPIEVVGKDGTNHDAISVTQAGKLTIGTASDQIVETQIATNQERITVDRNKDGSQVLESLAYLSDITSLETPQIQWQTLMDAKPVASGTYILKATDKISGKEVKAGDDDWVIMSYHYSSSYSYSVQLGMVKEKMLRTGENYELYRSFIIYNPVKDEYSILVNQDNSQKSIDYSINATGRIQLDQTVVNKGSRGKRTLYLRGSEYSITEEDIQNDLIIQAEPFVEDTDGRYSLTINFPTIDVFKKYYYIPTLNEDKKDTLPHIMDLNIQCWLDPEEGREDKEHRVYLRSHGDSIAWETSTKIGDPIGAYIRRAPNDTSRNVLASFNFMKIETGGSTIGNMGDYTAQTAEADHVYSLDVTPPPPNPVDGRAVNVTYFMDEASTSYESLNKEYPVILDEDVVDGQLIWITKAGTSGTDLPHVKGIRHAGDLASGIARSSGTTGSEIQSVTSGTFEFEHAYDLFGDEVDPQAPLTPYQRVFVSRSSGKLTAKNTGYCIGWILEDKKVLLDLDLYNSNASELGDGANSYASHFAGISTVDIDSGEGIIKESNLGLRNFLFDYDHALSGISLEAAVAEGDDDVVCAVKGIFPIGDMLTVSDQNDGDVIVLDSQTNKIQWPTLASEGSKIIGWYAGDNEVWIDVEMYNRFRDIERLASGGSLGDDIVVKRLIGKDSSGTGVEFVSTNTKIKAVDKTSIDINTEEVLGITSAGLKTNLPLDMSGQFVNNVRDAFEDGDAPNWLQVKNYVAENGGGGNGSGDISWVGNQSGNHGLIPFIEADDGKTLNSLELTYAQVSGAVTQSGTNTTAISNLAKDVSDVETAVANNSNNISFLKEDIDEQFEFDHVTSLEALSLTDAEFHAVHGDKTEIAKIFKKGEVRDGNKYILSLNQFVGKDFHEFLPSNFGGVMKVTSVHSYTHRDPSMVQEQLPPFKEHRVIFEWFDVTGGYYTAILDQDDQFSDFFLVNDEAKIAQNTQDISILKTDVDNNADAITNISGSVGSNTNQISTLSSQISQLDTEINKIENVIGIPSTQDLSKLNIAEQDIIDANGDVQAILRIFRGAKLYSETSEYHFVYKAVAGDDFYGFLPEDTGGVLSIVQYVSNTDPVEYYTLAQYINDGDVVKRTAISFSDSFDDWAAHSGGDSVVSLRNDFEKYKTITNATLQRLEETIGTLQTLLDSAFNHQSLSFSGNTLTSTMRNIKGEYSDATVFIDGNVGSEVPDTFNVYIGWDSNNEVTAAEIQQLGSEGKVSISTQKSELLTKEFTTTRTLSDEFDYKYSYIAFPKGAVDPDPDQVNYNGSFPATWIKHEVLLDGLTYVVMRPEYANNIGELSITLVQS